MRYKVEFTPKARKMLHKLDMQVSERIEEWIREHLEGCEDPRQYGDPLKGNLKWFWRYKVSDYRIIAEIQDDKVIILITRIGHRREVYRAK